MILNFKLRFKSISLCSAAHWSVRVKSIADYTAIDIAQCISPTLLPLLRTALSLSFPLLAALVIQL